MRRQQYRCSWSSVSASPSVRPSMSSARYASHLSPITLPHVKQRTGMICGCQLQARVPAPRTITPLLVSTRHVADDGLEKRQCRLGNNHTPRPGMYTDAVFARWQPNRLPRTMSGCRWCARRCAAWLTRGSSSFVAGTAIPLGAAGGVVAGAQGCVAAHPPRGADPNSAVPVPRDVDGDCAGHLPGVFADPAVWYHVE